MLFVQSIRINSDASAGPFSIWSFWGLRCTSLKEKKKHKHTLVDRSVRNGGNVLTEDFHSLLRFVLIYDKLPVKSSSVQLVTLQNVEKLKEG